MFRRNLPSEKVEEFILVNFQVSVCYCDILYRQARLSPSFLLKTNFTMVKDQPWHLLFFGDNGCSVNVTKEQF